MDTDILIIGGGLSGLALARDLSASGREVRLVEGRDRLGGRILGVPAHGEPDQAPPSLDAGPAWMWPGQERVERLVAELGLRFFEQHQQGFTVFEDHDGQVRRDIAMALNPGSLRIEGGLVRLIAALAEGVQADRVSTSWAATAVVRESGGFRVSGMTPSGPETTAANTVVVTVPPRLAAERIAFDGVLSDVQVDALRAVPTWMAGHAKALVVYETPFWHEAGLSGDAISRRGPLVQIHDASPTDGESGAIFGFVGLPADQRDRFGEEAVAEAVVRQLSALFGAEAAAPVAVHLQDWAREPFTATAADRFPPPGHPDYGMPAALAGLAETGLIFAGTEVAPDNGGLIEGALAAAEEAARRIAGRGASVAKTVAAL